MHDIKRMHTEDDSDEYNYAVYYIVIQCRGCENTSFRYVFRDYENAYPISNDEWDVPEVIATYPKFIKNHHELDGSHHVPKDSSRGVQGVGILAGLGLRGTIEAICNDRRITGRNLELRISRLATQGLISKLDEERLHAIRFLGNDAAHDIKKPTEGQIEAALRIIEHLITTVYILGAEAEGNLDTMVTDFDDFKKVLDKKLMNFSSGDEYPLAKFLGKDVRRIGGALSYLQAQLITEIGAGRVTNLIVGKVSAFGSPPIQLQHFNLI